MIKINLLGEEVVADHSGILILFGYVASMVVFLLAFVFMYSSVSGNITDLEGQAQLLEAQLNKLKVVTKEVKELEVKRAELRDKLAVIAKLKRSKAGPVRVMDDLNKALPERAWLVDVKEREGSLLINGMALDDQTIATFMRGLEESDYFGNVDLVQSRKVMWKGAKISEFSLEAKISYTGKIPPPTESQQEAKSTNKGS